MDNKRGTREPYDDCNHMGILAITMQMLDNVRYNKLGSYSRVLYSKMETDDWYRVM